MDKRRICVFHLHVMMPLCCCVLCCLPEGRQNISGKLSGLGEQCRQMLHWHHWWISDRLRVRVRLKVSSTSLFWHCQSAHTKPSNCADDDSLRLTNYLRMIINFDACATVWQDFLCSSQLNPVDDCWRGLIVSECRTQLSTAWDQLFSEFSWNEI